MWTIETDDILKLFLSVVLGGLIGGEREFYDKPAGFRTNILICIGSTLFTMFSLKVGSHCGMDPARIAAQVVTGIGFLGAGAIIRRGDAITGLTTAAAIWLVASIGMGVGAGYYSISLIGASLAIGVLFLFRKSGELIDRIHLLRTYHVVLVAENEKLAEFNQMLGSCTLRIVTRKTMKTDGHYVLEMTISGGKSSHETFLDTLLKSSVVKEITF
jgi:putative Mg2+ transporter-C (MgtC) family protein